MQLLYTGPAEDDAVREIARLEGEGNRVIPPAASWSNPDAPRCAFCDCPFGEDRKGGEVELHGTSHPKRWPDYTYGLRRTKRPRGPGLKGYVKTRLEICQACADELRANRETTVRRLQDEGGLSRKDAEAIQGGDDEALARAMKARGVPAISSLRRDRSMSYEASSLYREAAISGILGDTKEAESKRNDARAEELHLDRQRAIRSIELLGIDRERAEEVVDEIRLQIEVRCNWEESAIEEAREARELRWSIIGLGFLVLAVGLGVIYWPWLHSTGVLVRQCLVAAL